MIKNIVFDMGGVLISFDAERYRLNGLEPEIVPEELSDIPPGLSLTQRIVRLSSGSCFAP